jgi:hypothetical protein
MPVASRLTRVVDSTFKPHFDLPEVWSLTPRRRQIRRHVKTHGIKKWLALDDMRDGFEGFESHLVHCQRGIGLGDGDVQDLFARRLHSLFGAARRIARRCRIAGEAAEVKTKRKPLRDRAKGRETTRLLDYALAGVAKNLTRVLKQQLTRCRSPLTRRGQTVPLSRQLLRLLRRAFSTALLNPRIDVERAAKQRRALLFLLAATDVPTELHLSGVPAELRRRRKRRPT